MLLSPGAFLVYGLAIGAFIVVIFYLYIIKPNKEGDILEFEKFEDTVFENIDKMFQLQGFRSKAKMTHGFKNKLGTVEKYIQHKGEWTLLEHDPK